MNDLTQKPKRKVPKWATISIGVIAVIVLLARCMGGGSGEVDMSTATCKSLIPHVIAMSKGKDPEVLEITRPSPGAAHHYGAQEIPCNGQAEWSRGEGSITYGAYVSDGGQVIVEYKQD